MFNNIKTSPAVSQALGIGLGALSFALMVGFGWAAATVIGVSMQAGLDGKFTK